VSNGSESPSTPAAAATTPGGGVSAGHALPVTGAPMGAVVSLGALMVAAGALSVWYTRRRRNA
jgi:LPXTG-motif cell wall-anchored protein